MANDERGSLAATVAVDWGDRKHAWALQAADSDELERGELENTPEAVEAWAASLAQRFGGRLVAVALEQSRGALLFMLTKYAHLLLYPVHPGTLADYRKAWCPSGAKDDPADADLLLDLLQRHRDRLRSWEPDTVGVRTLQFLVEDRRALVDEKTRHSNRLIGRLKLYFPQVLSWFGQVDSALAGDLLERWPTLPELQRARPSTLQDFFHQHNCRAEERLQERIEQIRQATPATRDAAVIASSVSFVKAQVRLIAVLRQSIAELDAQIAELYAQQQDVSLFQSLPAAGSALEPRLLVAMGTRRDRYQTAAELQSYSGVAPLLQRSGRKQSTHFRRACPKFLRQTFHEWAGHTIGSCDWARQYYQQKREKGHGHHAAVRALAFKWIRILYRCWKDRTPYDEVRYLEALRRRRSPKPNLPTKFQWEKCGGFSRFAGAS